MKARKKLFSRSGETLVETLIAVLLIALVSVALVSLTRASVISNQTARDLDDRLYSAITEVETCASTVEETDGAATVTLGTGTADIDITVLTDSNGYLSTYKKAE